MPRTPAPRWRGLIEEYRDWLPVSDATPVVTLREGGTPLLPAPVLSSATGCEVYPEGRGREPDRLVQGPRDDVAISKAAEEGAQAVICASTGNTCASAAAYAARAGMLCAVLVPQRQDRARQDGAGAGARRACCRSTATSTTASTLASELADDYPVRSSTRSTPYRIEGQKTAAFEICDALGDAPDVHCLPVGNAGNITAYWKGYDEYADDGGRRSDRSMWGFQAAGAAPIVRGHAVDQPSTIATAIRIGNPASLEAGARRARRVRRRIER